MSIGLDRSGILDDAISALSTPTFSISFFVKITLAPVLNEVVITSNSDELLKNARFVKRNKLAWQFAKNKLHVEI